MVKHSAGIALHGTHSVVVGLDEEDRIGYQQRLRNEVAGILAAFVPYPGDARGHYRRVHL